MSPTGCGADSTGDEFARSATSMRNDGISVVIRHVGYRYFAWRSRLTGQSVVLRRFCWIWLYWFFFLFPFSSFVQFGFFKNFGLARFSFVSVCCVLFRFVSFYSILFHFYFIFISFLFHFCFSRLHFWNKMPLGSSEFAPSARLIPSTSNKMRRRTRRTKTMTRTRRLKPRKEEKKGVVKKVEEWDEEEEEEEVEETLTVLSWRTTQSIWTSKSVSISSARAAFCYGNELPFSFSFSLSLSLSLLLLLIRYQIQFNITVPLHNPPIWLKNNHQSLMPVKSSQLDRCNELDWFCLNWIYFVLLLWLNKF